MRPLINKWTRTMDDLIRHPSDIKRRRRYTREFKDQILAECADPNVSAAEVAHRHGINDNMIYNWRAARKAAGPDSFVQLPVIPSLAEHHNQFGERVYGDSDYF